MRKPELLLLDVSEHGDVISDFLIQMLDAAPLPVVLLSRKVLPNSDGERKAIRAGMAAMLVRPVDTIKGQDQGFRDQLIRKIRQTMQQFSAKYSKPIVNATGVTSRSVPVTTAPASDAKRHRPVLDTLIAIGASTGGTEALRHVIDKFPENTNAVVIVQHIPKAFISMLAQGMNILPSNATDRGSFAG